MFKFLKKKKDGDGSAEPSEEQSTGEGGAPEEKKQEKAEPTVSGNASADIVKLGTEIDKLKAGQEAFKEVRKANSEMFTRVNEQVGELRSMIFERDRTIQTLELKAVKAADLVSSIQPEKFMTQLQKQDVKIEALKANIESNEAIMDRIMSELKEVRKKVEFFRGVEEIVKLAEEVKSELIQIKKVEGKINIETDKVETIYAEMRKRIKDLDAYNSTMQEVKAAMDQQTKDIEFLKIKISGMADKAEVDKILAKLQEYTKFIGELKKKSSLSRDLEQLQNLVEGIK
jgi:chromosome segregation ATPase